MSFEATVGFEPTNEGFANLCLTTWPRRLADSYYTYLDSGFKADSLKNHNICLFFWTESLYQTP